MQGWGGSLAGTPQNPLSGEQEAAPGLVLARRAGSGQELLWAPQQGAQPRSTAHSLEGCRAGRQRGASAPGVLAAAGWDREPQGRLRKPCGSRAGPESHWGPLAQGTPGVRGSREPRATVQGEKPQGYLAAAAGRPSEGGQAGLSTGLIAPLGPPAPRHHVALAMSREAWGGRVRQETQLLAAGRRPCWLLKGSGSAWDKAHVSGAKRLGSFVHFLHSMNLV